MYYGTLNKTDITDGPGVRVALYVSGCKRHCFGCHNPETWDFNFGKEYTEDTEKEILDALDHDYVQGFTFCGGEPMEFDNQKELVALARKIREKFPTKDIWSWTGYEYEDLIEGGQRHCEVTDELLSYVDVLVVGPFVLAQRDITDHNRWRGSLNQRVVDMNKTRESGIKTFLEGIPNNE